MFNWCCKKHHFFYSGPHTSPTSREYLYACLWLAVIPSPRNQEFCIISVKSLNVTQLSLYFKLFSTDVVKNISFIFLAHTRLRHPQSIDLFMAGSYPIPLNSGILYNFWPQSTLKWKEKCKGHTLTCWNDTVNDWMRKENIKVCNICLHNEMYSKIDWLNQHKYTYPWY